MKLYVGNMPYSTTEAELESMFSAHGQVVSVAVINDRETGRSKGFGFVEMADKAAGNAAIEALNGNQMGGRALVVNEARPPKKREPRRY